MQNKKPKKLVIIIEDVLILLAIPVLWLTIFRLSGPIYKIITYATLGAMIVIFVRRFRRIRSES